MNGKILVKLELNKILTTVASYAVLPRTKQMLLDESPVENLAEAERLLSLTAEADYALFQGGTGRVDKFTDCSVELMRAQKGASLSCRELLCVVQLLHSARLAYRGIHILEDSPLLFEIAQGLCFDEELEDEIDRKILSEDEVSDDASEELFRIRSCIRALNERIKEKLSEYIVGDSAKYLQEGIVTMRDNRYVLPVRAEYKSKVRGFVHDRSASGATFFIEPEQILEMNNDLRELAVAEKQEIERILEDLSKRVGVLASGLLADIDLLSELDRAFAKAEFSYKARCIRPKLNNRGIIDIQKGRHPLLDPKTAVPVSIALGRDYRMLLISGPNTGGKTVTLKMCGLFCMMACCGIFIPAAEGSEVAVFGKIFCDIGDAQSIEENLSTFSSHVKNIIDITDGADSNSLVLVDELGGGTDPDEGQALAKAVIAYLLRCNCRGVVTTHYTSLKEYAYAEDGIENASMEFDMTTLQPLYRVSLGIPGSSNAIAISRRLGLSDVILDEAVANLSEGGRKFENILRTAEQSRIEAETAQKQAEQLKSEWNAKLAEVNAEREKLKKEREKLFLTAKVESRRIVNERTEQAEELLAEIEEIAHSSQITEADLIRARTLKNRLADKAYLAEAEESEKPLSEAVDFNTLKVGDRVFLSAMDSAAEVLKINPKKKEVLVLVGNMRLSAKAKDLFRLSGSGTKKKKDRVQVVRKIAPITEVQTEINLLGKTVLEANQEVDAFIDRAVMSGLEEVKIIHGIGTGKLRDGIRDHLRGMKNVLEFRSGVYGEGEGGVTIVKLK